MPRLYIEMLGGVVCGVYSNAATEVVLIDHDNLEADATDEDNITAKTKLLAEFEQDKMSPGFAELAIN